MTLAFRGDLLFAGDAVAYDSRLAGGTDSADFRIVRRGAGRGRHALDSRLSGKGCHEAAGIGIVSALAELKMPHFNCLTQGQK